MSERNDEQQANGDQGSGEAPELAPFAPGAGPASRGLPDAPPNDTPDALAAGDVSSRTDRIAGDVVDEAAVDHEAAVEEDDADADDEVDDDEVDDEVESGVAGDDDRDGDDPRAGQDDPRLRRLRDAIGGAAEQLGAREAIARLGERARAIVQELSDAARQREEASVRDSAAREEAGRASTSRSSRDGEASPLERALPELHRRLGELRACVSEVTDVLEGTVERLETVERQLGPSDLAVEERVAAGIEHCERVLAGIEHRLRDRTREEHGGQSRTRTTVLVVAKSAVDRSRLCLALERQGLHALAATGLRAAARRLANTAADAALLSLDGGEDERAMRMEEWREGELRGSFPPAAVLKASAGAGPDPALFEFAGVSEEHGEAALAASLLAMLGTRPRVGS